jgi:hypothetical protein
MEPHNWLGIAELVVGTVGVVLAVFFYVKGKRKLQLSYTIQNTQLIGGSGGILPEQVSISYEGNQITNLAKANYMVWNSGTDPIRHQDIVSGGPIMLNMQGSPRILKASILKSSLPQNGVKINRVSEKAPQNLEVDFEFLETGQGFNAEILYTGEVSQPLPSGTVIGMPQGLKTFNPARQEKIEAAVALTAGFGSAALIIYFAVSTWGIEGFEYAIDRPYIMALVLVLLIACLFVGAAFGTGITRRISRRSSLPKELQT